MSDMICFKYGRIVSLKYKFNKETIRFDSDRFDKYSLGYVLQHVLYQSESFLIVGFGGDEFLEYSKHSVLSNKVI